MRVCGVICEYDPFHNGHAYHLRRIRQLTGCDFVVCVMSGHFTQRGNAALLSKWTRARMALACGADAVFELPALFALRDAQRFAQGGVALLDSLGVVTHIGFGSESGDMEALARQANQAEDLAAIKSGLSEGKTLARARGESGLAADAPNDILAIEYLRALTTFGSDITPVTVRREGGGYHDKTLQTLASATAIREAVARGGDISGAMPPAAYALLREAQSTGAYQRAGGLDAVLLAFLRAMTPGALSEIADIGEGLENRLLREAQKATSREALLAAVKCKRYTYARLSRIVTQAMLGITKSLAGSCPRPEYARVLGFRRDARPLMAAISEKAGIPVITRPAKFRGEANPAFALDIRAGDLWALGCAGEAHRAGHADLTQCIYITEG